MTSNSLRKEQVIRDNLNAKGLPGLLANIRVMIKENDSPIKRYQKLVNVVIKKLQKGNLCLNEIVEYTKESYEPLKIQPVNPQSEDSIYICKLLQTFTKTTVPQDMLVEVIWENKTAYSIKDTIIKKRNHNRRWKLRNFSHDYKLVVDYHTVIAENYVENVLHNYIMKNKTLFQYLVIEKYFIDNKYKTLKLPTNKKFRDDVLYIIQDLPWRNYPKILSPDTDKYENFFYCKTCSQDTKYFIITEFLQQLKYIQFKSEQDFVQQASYSRSFQTKRYINHQTQNAMEDNVFLKCYGYIELDNDVCLNKFHNIERHFCKLMSAIHIPVAKDHSFRIKKLGKHRAAGIYFPQFKATILDIDHPESYAHELAHQIDYTSCNSEKLLSESIYFRHIIHVYKRLVDKALGELPEDNIFKKKWYGKTKYNSDYFLQKTEIFARSFELYLSLKEIDNMLVDTSFTGEVVYPDDAEYFKLIEDYFDVLLKKLSNL